MRCVINRIILSGAKNIDKEITILFTNKTINAKTDFSKYNVKAIYGPNGAGKSGIIAAMYIYKSLIVGVDGLNDRVFTRFINETINKATKSLKIDITFSIINETSPKKITTYRHYIELSNKNDNVYIKSEVLKKLQGQSINDGSYKELIEIKNGSIISLNGSSNFKNDYLFLKSLNLLNKYSIVNIYIKSIYEDLLKNNIVYDEKNEAIISIASVITFALNLVVEIGVQDMHTDYITSLLASRNKDVILSKEIFKMISKINANNKSAFIEKDDKDIILKENFDIYKERINHLSEFIKIFKPSLSKIIIDKKIDGEFYFCEKIFRYGNIDINLEFESTGIKKLVRLFNSLHDCANGSIAFIDEMDANLHDVYFNKLIEFFLYDSKGQLCFTTHNLTPIKLLKDYPRSLDFLSDDSRLYSWKKEGNTSPIAKYVDGLIPYSPFNVESFDFDILLDK